MFAARSFLLLACFAGLGSVVSAFNLTSFQGVPLCGINCITQQIDQSDCHITNQTCVCNDPFLSYVEDCFVTSCTAKEALVAKNQTSTACGKPVVDNAKQIAVFRWVICLFPAFFVLTRVINKCTKLSPWGWDDATIIFAYTVFLAFIPASFISEKAGAGRDTWTLTPEEVTLNLLLFFILTFCYMLSLAFIKASILFLYLRIFPDNGFRKVLWYTQLFNLLLYSGFFAASFASCQPLHYFWDGWTRETEGKCFSENAFGLAHGSINFVLDLWMLLLPASQIYRLNMQLRKKIGISLMFSVGIFLTAVSAYRLYVLKDFAKSPYPTDTLADSFQTSVWSAVELCVGIFVACLPSTSQVWSRLSPKVLQVMSVSSWSARTVKNTSSSIQTPKTISGGGYKRPRAIANEESSISDLVGEEIGKANTNQTEPSSVEAAPENGAKFKAENHMKDLESQLRAKSKEPGAGRSTERLEEYDLEVIKNCGESVSCP